MPSPNRIDVHFHLIPPFDDPRVRSAVASVVTGLGDDMERMGMAARTAICHQKRTWRVSSE